MTKADVQGRLNRETNPIPGERPGFNPQFIDSDGYATDVTPNTPFPSGSYVQTDAGVWVPQKGNNDGAAHVQLTGRNVELIARALDQDVSAGNKRYVLGFYNPTQLHEFRYIFTHVASGLDTGHDFDVGITYDAIEYTSGFSGSLVYEEFKEEFSKLRSTVYLKRHIPVLGDVLRIRIFNNDTVDHSYDVHLWGVK